MKGLAIGLSVRFLRVMMPVGRGIPGNSTRNTLSDKCLPRWAIEAGSMIRKRPLANRW